MSNIFGQKHNSYLDMFCSYYENTHTNSPIHVAPNHRDRFHFYRELLHEVKYPPHIKNYLCFFVSAYANSNVNAPLSNYLTFVQHT